MFLFCFPASQYEIRYSDNANLLASSYYSGTILPQALVLDGNLMIPKLSFQTEIMTVRLPPNACNPVCGIRLLAVDDVGNRGKPSNMVTVVISAGPPTTGQTVTTFYDVTAGTGVDGGFGGGRGGTDGFGGNGGGGAGGGAGGTGGGARPADPRMPTTTGPFAFTPGIMDPGQPGLFPTSGTGGGSDANTTKIPGAPPRGLKPQRKRKSTIIAAIAVVVVLLFITAIVIYSVIRHRVLTKRNRNRDQWANPMDAEADPETDKPRKKRTKGKVNDALVLEDM